MGRSLDSRSGGLPAGVWPPDSERDIFMECSSVSHPQEGDPMSAVLSLKYGGLLIKSTASCYLRRKLNAKKNSRTDITFYILGRLHPDISNISNNLQMQLPSPLKRGVNKLQSPVDISKNTKLRCSTSTCLCQNLSFLTRSCLRDIIEYCSTSLWISTY